MQENINIPDSNITANLTFRNLVLMNMQQLTNFPYIENDFDALTDYQLLCLVVKYLNDVITNSNEQNDSITNLYNAFLSLQEYVNNTKDSLEDAFNELDDYVNDYFNNLDVQEEINNKLDALVEDGTLTTLISNYLNPYIEAQNTEINNFKTSVNNQMSIQNAKIAAVESGSPLVASSTSEMTDTTKVYVNTTDGYWYYYDGDSWEQGGIYQATSNQVNDDVKDETLNLFEQYPLSNQGYIETKGTLYSVTAFRTTDYIPTKYFNKAILKCPLTRLNEGYYYINAYSSTGSNASLDYKSYIGGITPTLIDDVNHIYTIDLSAYPTVDYIRITTHNSNVSDDNLLCMYFNDLTKNSLSSFRTSISPSYLTRNEITSVKQLAPNYFYSLATDVNNTNLDIPNVSGLKTLIKIQGRNNGSINAFAQYILINERGDFYISYGDSDTTITTWRKLISSQNFEDSFKTTNIKYNFNKMFTAFKKFAVIGDSLSVGYYTDSSGAVHGRNLDNSWPQKICDNYNMKWVSLGFSGASVESWLSDTTYGPTALRNPDNKCQAYIIGMGANQSGTIGSVSDIDLNDYNNNANTMYGNYAKIIQMIEEVNPDAKIFTLTLPYPRVSYDRNTCIRNVSALFDSVTLVDLANNYNELFENDYIANNYYNYHFTPAGYSNIAELMMFCLSDAMYNNRTDFYDIPLIDYAE